MHMTLLVDDTHTYAGAQPAPREVKMSTVNYSSREVTFNWSPVAPNCLAISYNILSSNCGSCPTTTNHTNVTCTDVYVSPGDTCTFAVQTVANLCGRSTSTSISVNFASLINLDTHINQASRISISFLVTVLVVSLVVSTTVIAVCCVIIARAKEEIKALKLQPTSTRESKPHVESVYENVTRMTPSIRAINTKNNDAYGCT